MARAKSKSKVTPSRQQYLDIKAQHPDAIVFFRLGDFYETFDDDAQTAAQELDLVLTSRPQGKGVRTPMAGVPHHAAEGYIGRLIAKGYKVALAEQIGSETVNGLMPREVVRVFTAGTVIEPGMLDAGRNNYLTAVIREDDRYGLAYADITTGEFAVTQLEGQRALTEELARINPAELLVPENDITLYNQSKTVSHLPAWRFEEGSARQTLLRHFQVSTLAAFGIEGKSLATRAAGAILYYLQETQRGAIGQIQRLTTYSTAGYMALDSNTRRNLELLESLAGARQNSLLGILDKTVTPMGARLLRKRITRPLLTVDALNEQLDQVETFYTDTLLRADIRATLKGLPDLERLTNRVLSGKAIPRDLEYIKLVLEAVPELSKQLNQQGPDATLRPTGNSELGTDNDQSPISNLQSLISNLDSCPETAVLIQTAIADDAPTNFNKMGVIKPGFSAELDGVMNSSAHAREWVAQLEPRERERTGIQSLKVGFNKVFGYYIEVTRTHSDAVPDDYIRKQTLTSAERYITPELKEYETLILNAEDRILEIERRVFTEVTGQVAQYAQRLLDTANILAQIDVAAALAEVAANNNYVRPILSNEDGLMIENGRHPVVEHAAGTQIGDRFVPNDAHFNSSDRIQIITGPNMSGKCVSADTLIFTDQGLMPIIDLMPLDTAENEFTSLQKQVRGFAGPQLATHFFKGGVAETITIKTRLGYAITGTADHRIWVRFADGQENWQRLGDIQIKDVVAIERQIDMWGTETAVSSPNALSLKNVKRYPLPQQLTPDLAYVMGLLIGDGTMTYKNAVNLSTGDEFIAQTFTEIIQRLFNYPVQAKTNGKDYTISSKQIRVFFADLGLDYHQAHKKSVPASILKAPKEIVIAFLQGLFDADGFVENRYGNVRYATSSLKMAKEVQLLLLNFGIIASLQVKKTTRRPSYRISINGEDAIYYHKNIGFRLARKAERSQLASQIRMPNVGSIPHLASTLKQTQAQIVATPNKKVTLKQNKRVNSIFYTYVPNKRNISYRKLDELIAYCHQNDVPCTDLETVAEKNYFYDYVKAIETGEEEVYDLSVNHDHAYIANGFVSHNSTYLRQIALITLMAQIGSYVPADEAHIGLADRIFTRIGAHDELHQGRSTFMVEMVEAAEILNHATHRSLLILDEIGRGTSTYDGLAIAWSMIEYLHNHPSLKPRTLFATHYHELVGLADLLPMVANYNVDVAEEGDSVVFLHKIVSGGADQSYGIHVAQLAGLPRDVINRANEILKELEQHAPTTAVEPSRFTTGQQVALFPESSPILDELSALDVNTLTPLEAINKLYEWKRKFVKDN
jgi:DNA mismatch repair protein MutS